jgi:5-methylcytosine-specific restriction protein A
MCDGSALYCPLCERDVIELSEHHLVPKSRGGRNTEPICLDCHRMIHVLYDNKRLERELNTVASLQGEERFAKYLRWIRKRPGDRRFRARRSKVRGRRR